MKQIYDPIHKYMKIDPLLMKVIDCKEFQRLRGIKQLGCCYYVFSGASHNRFEHSVGVSHLSGKMVKQLQSLKNIEISDREILLVQIAGLVHDLGHACFSHLFDDTFLPKYTNVNNLARHHEYRSGLLFEKIMTENNLPVTAVECQMIKDLIHPQEGEDYLFIYDIVANAKSGLDCDKLDYLCRDTYNLGLPFSLEYSRLIDDALVIDNQICFPEKQAFNIYDIFHTRYRLHKQVYTHPVVRQIEMMVSDVLDLSNDHLQISQSIDDMDEFIKMTDGILERISFSDCKELEKARQLIDRIHSRDIYQLIGEVKFDCKEQLEEMILQEGLEDDLVVDQVKLGYWSKDEDPVENIYFYNFKKSDTCFKKEKDEVSELLPVNFEETCTRLIARNKDAIEKGQTLLNNVI